MRNKKFSKLPFVILTAIALTQLNPLFADSNEKEAAPYPQYHNRISVFFPWHQTYERIKNEAVYIGIDAWLAARIGGQSSLIGDAELRFGYNFFFNKIDHLRPFIGIGVFKDFHKEHAYRSYETYYGWYHDDYTYRRSAIAYGTLGFRYEHEFRSFFTLGADFKVLLGDSTSNSHTNRSWGGIVWGVDGALPITFRFGRDRHWDYRIEPFDTYLSGSYYSLNIIGFRNTIGYRF